MLQVVRDVAQLIGPFSSVSMDTGRASESAGSEITARFRALADRLTRQGAPDADVAALREVSTSMTGHGGEVTRLTVARRGSVVLDLVLPGAPPRDECSYGPAPHLLPAARSMRYPAPYLVVDVDHAGADIEIFGEPGAAPDLDQVQGSHELLHKVPHGGWSHQRMQARVQDSWDRNAAEVAAEVDRLVAGLSPKLVLVDGDPYAVSALLKAVGGAATNRWIRLESGGRAAGTDQGAHQAAIDAALAAFERAERAELLDRFASAEARQQEAVHGLPEVVGALRRGQAECVLLHDDPTSTATLWSGPEPLQIGMDRSALAAMGIAEPQRMRADAVLTRAVFASGGEISLLDDGDADLVDGIGALLRWSDRGTPHDAIPAMPGHGQEPN